MLRSTHQQGSVSSSGPWSASESRKRGSAVMMRAVNSCRSVAVSDALLAAQSAFEGGDFQPEAFPRCVCLLLEAFDRGDNTTKLCAVRLLERCRPYFGGSILAVEVAQRASRVLSQRDDPTTRELCLDLLAAVAFGAGGLPRGILLGVGRSLRSPFLAERQAAARAYASCMCAHRSSQSPQSSSSISTGAGSASSPLLDLTPRTLEEMAALSSALLPVLSPKRVDARGSALVHGGDAGGKRGAAAMSGRRGDGGGAGWGFAPVDAEGLLEAVLWKVTGDLPSTELWESLKVFLLGEGPATSSSDSLNISTLVDLVLYRLRSNRSASLQITMAAADAASGGGGGGGSNGNGNPALRAIAMDFFVSLFHIEAVERSKFAMAAAEAAVEAAAAAEREEEARNRGDRGEEDNKARKKDSAGFTTAAPTTKESPKAAPEAAAAPTPGRSSVWRLLDTLSASETGGEKAELLSVLGAPCLAVAVLDAEAVAGAKSASKMAAAHGVGDASGGGGGGGVSEDRARARIRFPLATAAVETFRRLCSSCSSSSALALSSPTLLACASSLVSYSVAAFRETPCYPADGSISAAAPRRDKALAALAELAAEGVLSSPPVLRLLSSARHGDDDDGGGAAAATATATGARLLFPQLRALAAVHTWPRRRVGLAVVRSLRVVPPRSPLAVDLAVLASHVVRAGEGGGRGGWRGQEGGDLERMLWELLFGRRFCDQNPKAAVGIAVALMRYHRGSLSRQSTLSAALVGAMGGGAGGGAGATSECDAGSSSSPAAASDVEEPEGSDPIVRDRWFQLVLCRECMLHGFFKAGEAGLRRLQEGQRRGGEGAVPASDVVRVWTEVLGKVSAAEAFFGGSPDPVAAHACAAHEIALASELLGSLPRRGEGGGGGGGASGAGRRSPSPPPQSAAAGVGGDGVSGVFLSGGCGDLFAFQRSFLQARAELLRLLGACWGMCQDLSATRTNRYARFSRREARCRRLPAAFRCVARDFRLLRGLAPGAGSTTSEPLRAASCLCLLLAIAADALLSQGKTVLMGTRDRGTVKKKSWRAWIERLVAGGGLGAEAGQEELVGAGGGAIDASGEGALMKVVRLLGARLLGLSDPPKAPIGRKAFASILESVRGTPFPMPRAFFRTGVAPRVALSVLPPAPPSSASAAMTGADGTAAAAAAGLANNSGSAWSGGQHYHHRHQASEDFVSCPAAATAASPGGAANELAGVHGGNNNDLSVGEKRQRRDGGAGAEYFGPSTRLRADIAESGRSCHPRLPLISAPANPKPNPMAGDRTSPSLSLPPRGSGGGGGGAGGPRSGLSFAASDIWWAQLVREEVMLAAPGGQTGASGGGGGGRRTHALGHMGSPGVWLVQGTVCRGRGTGGALPAVSEVVLEFSLAVPPHVASEGASEPTRAMPATRNWSKKVVAETFGAAADSGTALCFRAQVQLPAFGAAVNAGATIAAGVGQGGVMEVAVSLRSRGKQHDDRATDTGFFALGSGSMSDTHHAGGGVGDGDKEVWPVGTVSVPLPISLTSAPTW